MKVYFLNPPRYQERISSDFLVSYNVSRFSRGVDIVYAVTPPTELAVLASVVNTKYEVKILDANALNLLPRKIFRFLLKDKPDWLVIKAGDSTLLDDIQYYYFAEAIGIKTIFWEDILNPEYSDRLKKDLNIKRILWGEPERNIFKFIDGAEGIIGGDIIEDINTLPVPLMKQLPMERYKKEGKKNWYMFLHRGCGWGKCRFCLMEPKEIKFRERSAAHIRQELDELKEYGIETIFFWDPQINPTKGRVLEICCIMADYKFGWECWMRTDIVDEEMISCMKKSGCFRIHYGVESGNQHVLDSLNKGTTPDKIITAFHLARKYRIETAAYLCLGTIEESEQSFTDTIKLLKKIKPTTIVPSSFRPFPNVSLAKEMKQNNMLVSDHYQLALEGKCFGSTEVADSKYLTSSQIRTFMNKIHRMSTATAVSSYIYKPSSWKNLFKAFLIRTIRNHSRDHNGGIHTAEVE